MQPSANTISTQQHMISLLNKKHCAASLHSASLYWKQLMPCCSEINPPNSLAESDIQSTRPKIIMWRKTNDKRLLCLSFLFTGQDCLILNMENMILANLIIITKQQPHLNLIYFSFYICQCLLFFPRSQREEMRCERCQHDRLFGYLSALLPSTEQLFIPQWYSCMLCLLIGRWKRLNKRKLQTAPCGCSLSAQIYRVAFSPNMIDMLGLQSTVKKMLSTHDRHSETQVSLVENTIQRVNCQQLNNEPLWRGWEANTQLFHAVWIKCGPNASNYWASYEPCPKTPL